MTKPKPNPGQTEFVLGPGDHELASEEIKDGARCRAHSRESESALVGVNAALVVVYFNAAAERLFSKSRSEVLGKKLSPLLFRNPEMQERHDLWISKKLDGSLGPGPMKPGRGPSRYVEWEGRILDVELTVYEIKTKTGEVERECVARMKDVTDAVNQQRELEQLREELATELTAQQTVNRELKRDRGKTQRHVIFALMTTQLLFVLVSAGMATSGVEIPDNLNAVVSAGQNLLSIAVGYYFRDVTESGKAKPDGISD